ncbi:hypothetical protein [Nocardia brasiliensis]|uniref:hypothetical protein n=1 Tax=Nocardia brasiliensis TaxID=37326 RepID=UPI00245466AE|nr:hypothetical protein [Nocardia brasiliensis]
MTTSLTARPVDLEGIDLPAIEAMTAIDITTTPCPTVTQQRLTLEIGIGFVWVSLLYSSTGDSVLSYIVREDIATYPTIWAAMDADPDIGETVAAGRWGSWGSDGFARWMPDLELGTRNPLILRSCLAALEAMRTMADVIEPAALCVLQLQDALSNRLAGTHWVSITDNTRTRSATLIDALHAGRFLDEHDADSAALIAHAYRAGRFEDADDGIEIVHSSQLGESSAA